MCASYALISYVDKIDVLLYIDILIHIMTLSLDITELLCKLWLKKLSHAVKLKLKLSFCLWRMFIWRFRMMFVLYD